MTEAYKCDGCEQFFEGDPRYTLERTVGIFMTTYGEADYWPKHFDSINCTLRWAFKHREKNQGPPPWA